jgi:hypothetical protein
VRYGFALRRLRKLDVAEVRVVKTPSNEKSGKNGPPYFLFFYFHRHAPCSSLKADISTFSLSIEAESRIPESAERSEDPPNGTPVWHLNELTCWPIFYNALDIDPHLSIRGY